MPSGKGSFQYEMQPWEQAGRYPYPPMRQHRREYMPMQSPPIHSPGSEPLYFSRPHSSIVSSIGYKYSTYTVGVLEEQSVTAIAKCFEVLYSSTYWVIMSCLSLGVAFAKLTCLLLTCHLCRVQEYYYSYNNACLSSI